MASIKHRIKQTTSTRKGKIIFFSIIAFILALLAAAILYWQLNKKGIIRGKLKSAIEEKSQGLYKVHYDNLDLDEVSGFLSVTNFSLQYDSILYQQMLKKNEAPPILFSIQIPKITINGVKTPRALIDKEISGNTLSIQQPTIEVIYTLAGKDSARNIPTKEVYEQILGGLNQIELDTVLLSDAVIKTKYLGKEKSGVEINNATIQLTDIRIDSIANEDKTRLLFSKTIEASFGQLTWLSDNKLYKFSIDDFQLSSVQNYLSVGAFAIQPQLNENSFVQALPTQDDRFDGETKNIRIKNINFQSLLNENIIADSIIVESARLNIYRDLNIKRDTKNRVGTYPHQAIAKIPLPVMVKNIFVKNAFVEYKERSISTGKTGKVQFYNSSALVKNFTNDTAAIRANNLMSVDINTRFLNKTPLHTLWSFYLNNPNGRFDIKGSMGALPATAVNPLAEPMGPARIEDGTIKSLEFTLSGHDYGMDGSVRLLYEGLKVSVLKQDEDTKKLDKKGLASFAANILIKNDNPSGKDDPRVTAVHFDRNTNRSIFHLSWKTLFKGIKETVGIKK